MPFPIPKEKIVPPRVEAQARYGNPSNGKMNLNTKIKTT